VNGIQWSANQNGGDGTGMVSQFWKKWQLYLWVNDLGNQGHMLDASCLMTGSIKSEETEPLRGYNVIGIPEAVPDR